LPEFMFEVCPHIHRHKCSDDDATGW